MRFPPARSTCALLAALCALTTSASPPLASDPVAQAIQKRVQTFSSGAPVVVSGEALSSRTLIPEFYKQRGYHAAWTDRKDVDGLLAAIHGTDQDGLRPADYHLDALRKVLAAPPKPAPESTAEIDLLLTDALIRLAHHLAIGKVDPERLDPNWNLSRTIRKQTALDWLSSAIASRDLLSAIEALRPQRAYYRKLTRALQTYRSIRDRGGWPTLPAGTTLREGVRDPRVPPLRRRLMVTADLPGAMPADSMLFDPAVSAAVRRFQYRAFLDLDGAVGPSTARALNLPVEQRIDQIRVDLERARWVMHELPRRYVLVNVSSAVVFAMDRDSIVWRARCQVGQVARKTPVFRSQMKYLVFNPDWTVPPGILNRDILPALRRGEPVLQRKGLKVIDRNGRVVNPSTVRWPSSAKNLPYTIRQDPGPKNALGQVKFMFPNRHNVYLHDTPSKDLFEHSRRTFSSGCIRVERPLDLAEWVLDDRSKWNARGIRTVVETGKLTTVMLKEPLPVLLLYWTVNIDDQGLVRFSDDVYDRDAPVLRALDAPYRPVLRQGAR
ncbi:MAG TPA: L,D-transpeptidase family protein [Candidatus Eisenbacteria bacterium]|nr:L,D-transpeptidase family protein [Candidatus Eisenbacteria bacterium]